MNSKTRNKANSEINKLTRNTYFTEIPIDEISSIIEGLGGQLVDEAGEPLSCLFLGAEGEAHFEIVGMKGWLHITWYKMQSGRFEIVAYIL